MTRKGTNRMRAKRAVYMIKVAEGEVPGMAEAIKHFGPAGNTYSPHEVLKGSYGTNLTTRIAEAQLARASDPGFKVRQVLPQTNALATDKWFNRMIPTYTGEAGREISSSNWAQGVYDPKTDTAAIDDLNTPYSPDSTEGRLFVNRMPKPQRDYQDIRHHEVGVHGLQPYVEAPGPTQGEFTSVRDDRANYYQIPEEMEAFTAGYKQRDSSAGLSNDELVQQWKDSIKPGALKADNELLQFLQESPRDPKGELLEKRDKDLFEQSIRTLPKVVNRGFRANRLLG